MKLKTYEARYEDAPNIEQVIVFLALHGWEKIAAMPKYRKNRRTVNLNFMQDLINVVAEVEIMDTHTVLKQINAMAVG